MGVYQICYISYCEANGDRAKSAKAFQGAACGIHGRPSLPFGINISSCYGRSPSLPDNMHDRVPGRQLPHDLQRHIRTTGTKKVQNHHLHVSLDDDPTLEK